MLQFYVSENHRYTQKCVKHYQHVDNMCHIMLTLHEYELSSRSATAELELQAGREEV